jgi:hypothetical protein
MRRAGAELGRRDPSVPCGNLECLKDAELLAEVTKFCRNYPGSRLIDAASDASFVLYMLKAHEEVDRQNREDSN